MADIKYFRCVDFEGADFAGARFQRTDCHCADFSYADLENAKFDGARLNGADFGWSKLQDANFDNADLSGVDLRGANLYQTVISPDQLENLIVSDLGDDFVVVEANDPDLTPIEFDSIKITRSQLAKLIVVEDDGRELPDNELATLELIKNQLVGSPGFEPGTDRL